MAFWPHFGSGLHTYCSGWRKYVLALPLGIAATLGLGAVVLDTAIGHRWLVDMIASQSASSGLRLKIGRIDGSIYGKAQYHDVQFLDSKGAFLTVPEAALDWQALRWVLPNGALNVQELSLRRGKLLRLPELRSGDPHAPLLPKYDLRIAALNIEHLTIAAGVLGTERKVDFAAEAELRKGRALLDMKGALGGGDRLNGRVDVDEAHNRFDVTLDYVAPKGGLLAGLSGAMLDRRIEVAGKGDWQNWHGDLLAEQGGQKIAKASLDNRAGKIALQGVVQGTAFSQSAVQRIIGDSLDFAVVGKVDDGQFQGQLVGRSKTIQIKADGGADVRAGQFEQVAIAVQILDDAAFGKDISTQNLRGNMTVHGAFFAPKTQYNVSADSFAVGDIALLGMAAKGAADKLNTGWNLPLVMTAVRVHTGQEALDRLMIAGRGQGVIRLENGKLHSDKVALVFPKLAAQLSLDGDLTKGDWAIAGPIHAKSVAVAGIGQADVSLLMDARHLAVGRGAIGAWLVNGKIRGSLPQIEQASLAELMGDNVQFSGHLSAGGAQGLRINQAILSGSKLTARAEGRFGSDKNNRISGEGKQADYGSFSFDLGLRDTGLTGHIILPEPSQYMGLRDVRLDVSPRDEGLDILAKGQTAIGGFSGIMALILPQKGPVRLDISRLNLSQTEMKGSVRFEQSGVMGDLRVAGGGVDGTIGLTGRSTVMGRDMGQAMNVALALRDAHFGEDQPLVISDGRIDARGLLLKGHTTLMGTFYGAGIGKGRLFIGRAAGKVNLQDGVGQFTGSLAGRRGSNFDLQIQGDVSPLRVSLITQGNYAGQPIATPRPILILTAQGNWTLAPSELTYAGGRVIANGQFGKNGTQLDLGLVSLPLGLSDVVFANLGLGGKASGKLHFTHARGELPKGDAKILINGLTRSGLVLTSRPVDVALVGRLNADSLEMRAVVSESQQIRGRLQMRIGGLPASGPAGEAASGDLWSRLRAGNLAGGLRYDGPADAPFRLIALDHFDLTGPLALAADVVGSLDNPQIHGSLAGDGLRLQSALIGVDVSQISTRGVFSGSKLTLSRLVGQTTGGGTVEGSGAFDFSGMQGSRGPGIDLKFGAKAAQILARSDLAMTATGPLRIMSDGRSGTIAGRLTIDSARWRLGQSAVVTDLPQITTKETGRSADVAPASAQRMPWRFLVDASGPGRIRVQGLGIDSEWGADLHLRGSLDAPTLLGQANMVRGSYDFAGKSFDLRRGQLIFDGQNPINPRLDIVAMSESSGLNASILVRGTSLRPEISFASVPVLPEEELLSRLLFGSSITQISAPEALQLGAALAALRGGGGLDPINTLRRAIGLDRLRIIGADVTQGRQTGIAVGKYLGRRVYAEIVTDGRGYSATNLEFRVTSWLSLLGSVSTVGRQSVNARVSKDY